MAVPTMEESALCSQLIERVKDYFQSAEHKKELPAWDNMSGGAWNINNNACIVATAMKEYFVNGTLPEETIAASNNILDFQVIAKVGGKYSGWG